MAESNYGGGSGTTSPSYTARGFQGKTINNLKLPISDTLETEWIVSVVKSSRMFHHHSLLFKSFIGGAFIVELMVQNKEVVLRYRSIDLSNPKYQGLDMEKLGIVNESVSYIIQTAKRVLEQLGFYHYTLNNCQDYCQELAKELGCCDYWTDVEKVVIVVVVVGLLAAGVAAHMCFTGGKIKGNKKKHGAEMESWSLTLVARMHNSFSAIRKRCVAYSVSFFICKPHMMLNQHTSGCITCVHNLAAFNVV